MHVSLSACGDVKHKDHLYWNYLSLERDMNAKFCFLIMGIVSLTMSVTLGLRCYQCSDLTVTTNDAHLNDAFKRLNKKCELTDDSLTTCPSGPDVKCYSTTTETKATQQGKEISAVHITRGCYELTDLKEGCEAGDPTSEAGNLPSQLTPQGTGLAQTKSVTCFCSGDKCNGVLSTRPGLTHTIVLSCVTVISALALSVM